MAIGEKRWGYDKPDKFSNYERLEREKLEQQVITSKSKKKYKAPDAMCVRMPRRFGGKDRLKQIAKRQNKRYHTLAVDYIMEGIERDEKRLISG